MEITQIVELLSMIWDKILMLIAVYFIIKGKPNEAKQIMKQRKAERKKELKAEKEKAKSEKHLAKYNKMIGDNENGKNDINSTDGI